MEVIAKLKFSRLSPQKCRLVCDQIRGLPIERALDILSFSPKRPAAALRKLLNSAVANAENNFGLDIDNLKVAQVYADQGSVLKRTQAKAKGRGSQIKKPTCHIVIVLSDEELG